MELEKRIFLQTIDYLWRSHLQYLEHLRQVVGLRGYAQKDPLEEFKKEAFKLFENLLYKIKTDFITFLNHLELFTLAESLGGVESLICHPATMTHASVSKETKLKIGITDSLIRFSVGCENIEDLSADLNQAFGTISGLKEIYLLILAGVPKI